MNTHETCFANFEFNSENMLFDGAADADDEEFVWGLYVEVGLIGRVDK